MIYHNREVQVSVKSRFDGTGNHKSEIYANDTTFIAQLTGLRIRAYYYHHSAVGDLHVSSRSTVTSIITLATRWSEGKINKTGSTLNECFQHYLKAEEIPDGDCDQCSNRRMKMILHFTITTPLPVVLFVHLNRLFWDGSNLKKVTNNLRLPFVFSIPQHEETTYILRAVVCHYGSGNKSGHQVCFVKKLCAVPGTGGPGVEKWLYFDDQKMKIVTEEYVKRIGGTGGY